MHKSQLSKFQTTRPKELHRFKSNTEDLRLAESFKAEGLVIHVLASKECKSRQGGGRYRNLRDSAIPSGGDTLYAAAKVKSDDTIEISQRRDLMSRRFLSGDFTNRMTFKIIVIRPFCAHA